MKNLQRAAGYSVGLPDGQRAGFLFDDAGRDVGKSGELRGQKVREGEHVRAGCDRLARLTPLLDEDLAGADEDQDE